MEVRLVAHLNFPLKVQAIEKLLEALMQQGQTFTCGEVIKTVKLGLI